VVEFLIAARFTDPIVSLPLGAFRK
jgi:hypothetical protein